MRTLTTNTPALQIGDVVHMHGARFQLVEQTIDQVKAQDLALGDPAYILANRQGWDARKAFLDQALSRRAFRAVYMGSVDGSDFETGTDQDMPANASIRAWNIDGTFNTMITRELRDDERRSLAA
jgi:hypothetical protein